jgi:hypothetical protein
MHHYYHPGAAEPSVTDILVIKTMRRRIILSLASSRIAACTGSDRNTTARSD